VNVYTIDSVARLNVAHLDATGFANDAPETIRYCNVVEWAWVSATHAHDDIPFSLAIADWQTSAFLCSSGFDGQLGPAVKQAKQLAVNSVYQHSHGFDASHL